MTATDLLSWYEANLPARERKLRGHFSTPRQLVEQILDACGYTPDHDLSSLRVLDPACGSGNFLAGAAARLLAHGKRAGLSEQEQAKRLQHNIWGFDPDPVACSLAEMQLQQTLSQFQCTQEGEETNPPKKTDDYFPHRFHIHQADGLAFPWRTCENVDLFLANPPYLASKNTDLSGYLAGSQKGQVDSYLLFLRLALQIVRPDGWIGLVLPDPVLARTNATYERQRLLSETTVHHLWHLADVFTACVGAVVIIAQKRPPTSMHQIAWKRGQWLRTTSKNIKNPVILAARQACANMIITRENMIAQKVLRSQPRAELRYLLSEVQGTLVAELHAYNACQTTHHGAHTLIPLGEYVAIRRGEEIAKDSAYLSITSPERPDQAQNGDNGRCAAWYPVLRGGVDVRAYSRPLASCWLPLSAISKPLDRYRTPKLLVIKSVGRLQAALDMQGHIVLQTLYMLLLQVQRPMLWTGDRQKDGEHEDALYFLLALLNSRILREYVYTLYTAYKLVQPQIEQHILKHLPIPIVATQTEKEQIVQLARQLIHIYSQMTVAGSTGQETSSNALDAAYNELYEEQEQVIRSLYVRALQGDGMREQVMQALETFAE